MIRLDLPRNTAVHALGFASGGATLAYLQNRKLRYWDLAAGCPREEWEPSLKGSFNVLHLAASPDGSRIAAGRSRDEVRILELDPEPRLSAVLKVGGGEIAGLQFLGEPDQLVVAPTYEQIGDEWPRADRTGAAVWDVVLGKCTATMRLQNSSYHEVKAIATPAGRPLVALGISGVHALVWEPELGEVPGPAFEPSIPRWAPQPGAGEARRHPPLMYGGGSSAKVLAFSPDGGLLAAVVGSRIIPWDLESRTRFPTLTGHGASYEGGTGATTAMAFAPVGRLLASVGREGTLRLWDPADAARPERACFQPGLGGLRSVAFSPEATLIAVGGDQGIALIDVDERLIG